MMDPDDFRACLISMGYDLVRAFSPGQNMTASFIFLIALKSSRNTRTQNQLSF